MLTILAIPPVLSVTVLPVLLAAPAVLSVTAPRGVMLPVLLLLLVLLVLLMLLVMLVLLRLLILGLIAGSLTTTHTFTLRRSGLGRVSGSTFTSNYWPR